MVCLRKALLRLPTPYGKRCFCGGLFDCLSISESFIICRLLVEIACHSLTRASSPSTEYTLVMAMEAMTRICSRGISGTVAITYWELAANTGLGAVASTSAVSLVILVTRNTALGLELC